MHMEPEATDNLIYIFTRRNDIQHNDIQHNDTQHYDTQHYDYKKRLVSKINPSLFLEIILYNTWTLQIAKFN